MRIETTPNHEKTGRAPMMCRMAFTGLASIILLSCSSTRSFREVQAERGAQAPRYVSIGIAMECHEDEERISTLLKNAGIKVRAGYAGHGFHFIQVANEDAQRARGLLSKDFTAKHTECYRALESYYEEQVARETSRALYPAFFI